jgi:hypothetical protein
MAIQAYDNLAAGLLENLAIQVAKAYHVPLDVLGEYMPVNFKKKSEFDKHLDEGHVLDQFFKAGKVTANVDMTKSKKGQIINESKY